MPTYTRVEYLRSPYLYHFPGLHSSQSFDAIRKVWPEVSQAIGSRQNDEQTNLSPAEALLVRQVLIDRDQHIKCSIRERQQLTILLT